MEKRIHRLTLAQKAIRCHVISYLRGEISWGLLKCGLKGAFGNRWPEVLSNVLRTIPEQI